MTIRGYSPVPEIYPNEKEHRRQLARGVNGVLGGKMNAVTALTLTASVATTTLTDARITPQSFIGFMPQTANAAAEALYVDATTQFNGSAVITHANNAQTDRNYIVLIIG